MTPYKTLEDGTQLFRPLEKADAKELGVPPGMYVARLGKEYCVGSSEDVALTSLSRWLHALERMEEMKNGRG